MPPFSCDVCHNWAGVWVQIIVPLVFSQVILNIGMDWEVNISFDNCFKTQVFVDGLGSSDFECWWSILPIFKVSQLGLSDIEIFIVIFVSCAENTVKFWVSTLDSPVHISALNIKHTFSWREHVEFNTILVLVLFVFDEGLDVVFVVVDTQEISLTHALRCEHLRLLNLESLRIIENRSTCTMSHDFENVF